VDVPTDDLERWVKLKEELSVFAPRQDKSSGPNYLPRDIAEILKAKGVSRPVDES
jgi:hypothetical protein